MPCHHETSPVWRNHTNQQYPADTQLYRRFPVQKEELSVMTCQTCIPFSGRAPVYHQQSPSPTDASVWHRYKRRLPHLNRYKVTTCSASPGIGGHSPLPADHNSRIPYSSYNHALASEAETPMSASTS